MQPAKLPHPKTHVSYIFTQDEKFEMANASIYLRKLILAILILRSEAIWKIIANRSI
jgi:hypothetical protein